MTAFAFILGCIPLWTASGAGGISRQVLGTVVIGGMLASTIIAIFIVPVTFAVVERLSHRFSTSRIRKETREPVISGDGR
jgi:HAE1 family hydrophobic/amphiphilic exporter-1